MKRVLNFGSLNIDHVYNVEHIARPGETIASLNYAIHAGGKGANQSMALGRAGASVAHAGAVGSEGLWLREKLETAGVDVSMIRISDGPGGHAIIQVDAKGENTIVLHGGANIEVASEQIESALDGYGADDVLLLQNEINMTAEIMQAAHQRGMAICLNPAPMTGAVAEYPLSLVDYLIVNETEGADLSGAKEDEEIATTLSERYGCVVVLTLGARGAMVCADGEVRFVKGVKVKNAVDTTAAGDTVCRLFSDGHTGRHDAGRSGNACLPGWRGVCRQSRCDGFHSITKRNLNHEHHRHTNTIKKENNNGWLGNIKKLMQTRTGTKDRRRSGPGRRGLDETDRSGE